MLGGAGEGGEERRAAREALEERFASLVERVRALHLEVCGADMPAGMGVAAAVALVEEGLLGGVRGGGFRERVGVLEKLMSG